MVSSYVWVSTVAGVHGSAGVRNPPGTPVKIITGQFEIYILKCQIEYKTENYNYWQLFFLKWLNGGFRSRNEDPHPQLFINMSLFSLDYAYGDLSEIV